MTLHRIYVENGNRAGFWVQHRSWPNACALVTSVGGQSEGNLAIAAPAVDGVHVLMDVFDVRSGRPLDQKPLLNWSDDRAYTRIAEPYWRHGVVRDRARSNARMQ